VKVITTPTVTLVSAPQYHSHPVYALPPHAQDAENIVAMGGKVCYDSYGLDGNPVEKHIRNLVDSGHHSVLEHVHVGVLIEGISRGCSHEIVRHRMFNYSQRSTRYTAEDDAAIVLDPYFARIYACPEKCSKHENDMAGRFLEECEASFAAYRELVRDLEAANPEQAERAGSPEVVPRQGAPAAAARARDPHGHDGESARLAALPSHALEPACGG
jgi:thymidylate synthase (FAD)